MLIALPDNLVLELRKMRRDPSQFTVVSMTTCKMGCGKGSAFSLAHPDSQSAGTWCALHGWIFFDSVKVPPIGEQHIPKKRKKAA